MHMLNPPSEERAEHLRRLTRRLAGHLADRLRDLPFRSAGQIVDEGLARLRRTIDQHRNGIAIEDATAIRIAMDLQIVRVRDEAWLAVQAEPTTMTTMLLDVAERTEPTFLAPVGSLLAIAAWYQGRSDVAARVVADVLAIRPSYTMARLVTAAVRFKLAPEALRGRMPTPAEIDLAMGPPRPGWLLDLQSSLHDFLDSAGQRADGRPVEPGRHQRPDRP